MRLSAWQHGIRGVSAHCRLRTSWAGRLIAACPCGALLLGPPSACRINSEALLPDPRFVEFSPIAKLAIFEWHELIVDALGEDKPVARVTADVKYPLVKDGSIMYGWLGRLVSMRPVDSSIAENPATEFMLRIYVRLNGASCSAGRRIVH